MKKIIIFSIFIINISFELLSLDTSSVNFMPLAVGNVWIYKAMPNTTYYRMKIMKDTIINNKKYFFSQGYPFFNGWIRTDTITGSLYKFDSSCHYYDKEILIDSLAQLSGQRYSDCHILDYYTLCNGINNTIIFGINTIALKFSYSIGSFANGEHKYAKYFGYYYKLDRASFSSTTNTLVGCFLNGVLYGDTSTPIGIVSNSTGTPEKYVLSQNYPNPFNPITNIEFEIKEKTFTKIIVYDVLGIELCILVNENLGAGKYNVNWDATSYSSGVYIYKLITDKFVETKKMVLIK